MDTSSSQQLLQSTTARNGVPPPPASDAAFAKYPMFRLTTSCSESVAVSATMLQQAAKVGSVLSKSRQTLLSFSLEKTLLYLPPRLTVVVVVVFSFLHSLPPASFCLRRKFPLHQHIRGLRITGRENDVPKFPFLLLLQPLQRERKKMDYGMVHDQFPFSPDSSLSLRIESEKSSGRS